MKRKPPVQQAPATGAVQLPNETDPATAQTAAPAPAPGPSPVIQPPPVTDNLDFIKVKDYLGYPMVVFCGMYRRFATRFGENEAVAVWMFIPGGFEEAGYVFSAAFRAMTPGNWYAGKLRADGMRYVFDAISPEESAKIMLEANAETLDKLRSRAGYLQDRAKAYKRIPNKKAAVPGRGQMPGGNNAPMADDWTPSDDDVPF